MSCRSENTRTPRELGRFIARAHYRAWRTDAPPFDLTVEELSAILPNLIESGSAGIVWHRVKPVCERFGALSCALEAATEAQIAHNRKVEEAVLECVARLRVHGIEPVLVKGLAIARLYPEGIVRPAGDIDLIVKAHEFAAAHAILHDSSRDPLGIDVDLKHPAIWDERPNDDYGERLRAVDVGGVPVSVLSPEDNLRMLCFHFMKHGGLRPLWLCDIVLVGENTSDAFCWKRVLGGDAVRRNWMVSVLGVAQALAGSRAIAARSLGGDSLPPAWLVELVLRGLPGQISPLPSTMADLRANPRDIVGVFRRRWPNPVVATWRAGSPFDVTSPLRRQWLVYVKQIGDYMAHRLLPQVRK